MALSICNQTISSLLTDSPPFKKVIALDYHDGPTSGAVQCAGGTAAYRFELLAIDVDGVYDGAAWDRGEELRVYGLAPLSSGSFEHIVRILAELEEPRWPIWAPGMKAAADRDGRIERKVLPLLDAEGRHTLVVAGASPLGPFRAARELGSAELDKSRDADWFAILGFGTPPPVTHPASG